MSVERRNCFLVILTSVPHSVYETVNIPHMVEGWIVSEGEANLMQLIRP